MRAIRSADDTTSINHVTFQRVDECMFNRKTRIELFCRKRDCFVVKHYRGDREYERELEFLRASASWDTTILLEACKVEGKPRQIMMRYHLPLQRLVDDTYPLGMCLLDAVKLCSVLCDALRLIWILYGYRYTDIKLDNIVLKDGKLTEPILADLSGWYSGEEGKHAEYSLWCEHANVRSEQYAAFCLSMLVCQLWGKTIFHRCAEHGASKSFWKSRADRSPKEGTFRALLDRVCNDECTRNDIHDRLKLRTRLDGFFAPRENDSQKQYIFRSIRTTPICALYQSECLSSWSRVALSMRNALE